MLDRVAAAGARITEEWAQISTIALASSEDQVRAYHQLDDSLHKAKRTRRMVMLSCAGVFMVGVFNALRAWWHPAFLSTAAVFFLPKRHWYLALVPLNLSSYFIYHCLIDPGATDPRIIIQGVMNCCACVYVQLVTDNKEWDFFQKMLETERMRLNLGAKMAMVQRLMDSLFDACCFCNEEGHFASASPGLEKLLGGRLEGVGLLDLTRSLEEHERAKRFLTGLAQSEVAGKINLSLRLPKHCPGLGGLSQPHGDIDVSVSAIALPRSAQPGELDVGRIYLGFQAAESQPPPPADEAAGGVAIPRMPLDNMGGLESISEASPTASGDMAVPLVRLRFSDEDDASEKMSCHSAPAVLMRPEMLDFIRAADPAKPSDSNSEGDCLPPDAVVWVEGRTAPLQLREVSVGMRVLCHDRLSRGMKFAPVVEAFTQSAEKSDWVTVVLEDGQELEMTSDHPVFPAGGHTPVRAAELRPDAHAVEVLQLVRVPVREVKRLSTAPEQQAVRKERVSLSVQQPDRHAIFVAPRPGRAPCLAVGSASVEVGEVVDHLQVPIKNTFLHGVAAQGAEDDDDDDDLPPIRRVETCPAGFHCFSSESGSPSSPRHVSSRASVSSSWRSESTWKSSDVSPRTIASASSKQGRVVLGAVALSRSAARQQGTNKRCLSEEVRLSQLLGRGGGGLRSIGSEGHGQGQCVPCLMQAKWSHGKCAEPCKFRQLCVRCHEPHTEQGLQRIQNKMSRMRRRTAADAGISGGA